MTAGQIAALIAAGAFVVLVLLLAVPLLKLGRTLDEATIAIRKAHEGSAPLLDDAQVTLRQVNTQLDRVDGRPGCGTPLLSWSLLLQPTSTVSSSADRNRQEPAMRARRRGMMWSPLQPFRVASGRRRQSFDIPGAFLTVPPGGPRNETALAGRGQGLGRAVLPIRGLVRALPHPTQRPIAHTATTS